MKKCLLLALFSILGVSVSFSQVSPYAIPPKWMFGKQAGLNFMGGALPTSPILSPPIYLAGNPNTNNQEGATSVCDTSRNVALYTPDGVNLYNNANAVVASNLKGGTSSVQNSISFPDPANPVSQFYIVTANVDPSGGSVVGTSQGVNYVVYTKAGALVSSGNLIASGMTNESITASSDFNGGYWIVAHHGGASQSTNYYSWHVTSGGVGAMQTFSGTIAGNGYQGSLKINNCQNKIGFVSYSGGIEIYNWNATTGKLGTKIYSFIDNPAATYGMLYGAEFSPDGSKFYFTSLLSPLGLFQVDMSAGNLVSTISTTAVNGISEFGTMQLGPDGKIYVINSSNFSSPAYIPTITAPNNAAGSVGYNTSYFQYAPAPFYPNFYRGIANLTAVNPNNPVITPVATATCNVYNFSYVFNTYFNSKINVTPGSEVWNFGDGTGNLAGLGATPSHTFPAGSGGPYPITLTVTDATCGQTWTGTSTVTVTCPAPVELISFNGVASKGGVDLIWKTAMELNNDYFDLQRSSDGIHFTSIAHITGAGTSKSTLAYSYRDTDVMSGVVYYKLAQHDYDGTISYSKIISVHFDKTGSAPIVIAPNPFSSSFTVSKIFDEAATISVYDILGRLLEQKTTSAAETTISLGESLVTGSYIVQYLTGSSTYTLHIEKK